MQTPVPTNTLEVCKIPACVVDRPLRSDLNSQTPGSISLGPLGYRVLHADGTLMLLGRPGSRQLGIEGAGNPRRFAVKFVSRLGDNLQGLPFSASDLEFAEIRIYRAKDGKRV